MAKAKSKQSGVVKHDASELPNFLALLERTRPEDWKLHRRTFYRWREGNVGESIDALIRNPALLKALARDVAETQKREREAETK